MAFTSPYPPGLRKAVLALLERSDLSMLEIARRTGVLPSAVRYWNDVVGIRPSAKTVRRDDDTRRQAEATPAAPPGDAPDLASLDAALRSHIARQIAALDDRLRRGKAAADSAKTLRDLGGLRRLLTDLGASARRPDSNGDADGIFPQDLAALRDRIARRYEAFEAGRPDAGLPEPSAAGGPGEAGA